MRIFLVFVIAILFFTGPAYALMPSSTEEIPSGNIEPRPDDFKKEKADLMKNAMPLREERKVTLRPFVIEGVMPPDLKGAYAPISADLGAPETTEMPMRRSSPEYALNFLFLSLLIGAILASYFFIRPRSK